MPSFVRLCVLGIEFVKMGIRGLSLGVMGQVKRVDPLIFPARIEAIRFGICNLAQIEYPVEFYVSATSLKVANGMKLGAGKVQLQIDNSFGPYLSLRTRNSP